MKILKNLICFLLLLPMVTTAQDNKGLLLNITEITVKPGHNAQFTEGVKLWKECYLKNNGTDHWNIWHRVQGKGNVYVLTGTMAKWAEMDKKDPASDACRITVLNFIMPNVESVEYNIAQNMPEFSRPLLDSTKLIWVTSFKIKNSTDFTDVVKGISSAIKTTEGNNRGYWYRVMGGAPEAPDYFITEPFKGYADLDKDEESIWKVYEKVNGKKAADALKAKATGAIDKMWSYIYTLDKDLSN
ncbi:MAG TPA: hypothetical protein VFI29_17050 [Hanamia sp.]|nr:hypothetical protein [Hanamia sp.]